jgi:hypothetical protein
VIDSKLNSNQEEETEEGNNGGAGRKLCCGLDHRLIRIILGILPFHGITPVG